MKSKPTKQTDPELDDDDSTDVDANGPAIASAKKSKITIIAASSVLVTVVLYVLFFSGDDKNKEKLEIVEAPKPSQVAPSDNGKSVFEIEKKSDKKNLKDDVDLLSKPTIPEIPTLPELPKDAVLPSSDILLTPPPIEEKKDSNLKNQEDQQNKLLPTQQSNNQQVLNQNNQQQQPVAEVAKPTVEEKIIDPRYAPIVVFSGATEGGGPARSVGYDKNIVKLKEDPISDLKQTQSQVTATYISDRSTTIAQGKLLTAVLETAINTEIPGLVRAIVSRDVYGESGSDILIPKGSRLFGSYASKILKGQGRVDIGWTRLIRPDGVDLAISFNAADQFGRAGLSGEIDNKYGSLLTNSLLTSILAVGGVAAAQKLVANKNNQTSTTTSNPTQGTTTTTGTAANQALADVTKTIIDLVGQVMTNSIDVTPVIRVPQGTRITVIVNSDIKIPPIRKK